ncbi:MAG: bifunctional adenosylcobinamide kinase/adenosylcobinamide-phosphate guanylyltransferase [Bacillota bacterium]|nr:bifunctional adenosylcobinamide kinase/adenosylcobinamide-phosphate guanylyltransferase [Bacillota bacterium]
MRVLLTGGSACGKSTYGEALAASLPQPRLYVATMRPYGEESLRRIARHRQMRAAKGFTTIERYTDIAGMPLPAGGTVLLECLCNLTANEMFEPEGAGADCVSEIMRGLHLLADSCDDLIVVTNDVGSDGGGYGRATMEYAAALAWLNNLVAAEFDHVLELCAGIPLALKGGLPCLG